MEPSAALQAAEQPRLTAGRAVAGPVGQPLPARSRAPASLGAPRRAGLPDAVLLGLITAFGLGLRLVRIDTASFWSDEVFSVFWARSDLAQLWGAGLEMETTPPLYYTLLKGWMMLFGTGEAGVRSLSAVLSAATIPVVFLLGRELASRRAALLAALLFALMPVQIHYAQEARAYALLVLLAAATTLSLARLLDRAAPSPPRSGALAAYMLCATALIYTHATSPLILAALVIAALACLARRHQPRGVLPRFLAANLAVAVLALPQCAATFLQAGRGDVAWIEPPSVTGLITIAAAMLVDPFTPLESFRLAALLAAAVAITLIAQLPSLPPWRRARAFLVLGPAVFLSVATLVSFHVPFLIPRITVWISVPVCILAAVLLLADGARARRTALALCLAVAWAVGLHGVMSLKPAHADNWRGLSAALAARASAADLVVIGPATIPTGIALYAGPLRATRRWLPEGASPPRDRFLPAGVPVPVPVRDADLAREVHAGRRIWLVLTRNDWLAHGPQALAAVPDAVPAVDQWHALLVLLGWGAPRVATR